MHSGNITIDSITKIEGTAGIEVTIENDKVTDLKFMIKDYRRFYTEAIVFIQNLRYMFRCASFCLS
jgi:coenzyme F420-reducing hydrogenase alpha subunit